jgi:hypothetical protein
MMATQFTEVFSCPALPCRQRSGRSSSLASVSSETSDGPGALSDMRPRSSIIPVGAQEYHKVLKTGCQVEHRQYETSAALEAITGLLAIVAVRLLQLRSVARTDPQRPAEEVVPRSWVNVLQVVRRRPRQQWTVRQFFRELAGLGGFLGRKHDGEPGWLTIWRGFDNLVPALILADGAQEMWVNLSYEPWDAKVRAEFCVSCCSANDLGVPAQPCGLDSGDCKLVNSKCKLQIEYTDAETAGHHHFSICIY